MKKGLVFLVGIVAVLLLIGGIVAAQEPQPAQPDQPSQPAQPPQQPQPAQPDQQPQPPQPDQQPQPAQPPQQPQPRPPQPPMDPLHDVIYPPEMIMQHQRELALTDEQKAFMRGEVQRSTTRFNELQWQLQDAMEALHDTMKANPVNEQLAMGQLDKVLDSEREIKRLHMELAIRLKNKLTPEQQTKLQAMRMPPHGMGPGMHGPGFAPGMPGSTPPAGPAPASAPRPEGRPRQSELLP